MIWLGRSLRCGHDEDLRHVFIGDPSSEILHRISSIAEEQKEMARDGELIENDRI